MKVQEVALYVIGAPLPFPPTWRGTRLVAGVDGRHRCAALAGVVGEAVGCRVYERRPKACWELEPGGEACRSIRGEV